MANIPLNVLIEAVECFELVRKAESTFQRLSANDYLRVLKASSALSHAVQKVTNEIQVGCEESAYYEELERGYAQDRI